MGGADGEPRDAPRRTAGRVVLAVVAALVAVMAVVVLSTRDDDGPPPRPLDPGLLAWEPRGELRDDTALIRAATEVWRGGVLVKPDGSPVPGGTTGGPTGEVHVLWAGAIGVGRLVLLQALAADAAPLIAQVSEHGDPATLGLDLVSEISADGPVIAVTYDGNLDIPGLSPGAGADLVQLLEAPVPAGEVRTLWRQVKSGPNAKLELLEMSDGMSNTFLHVGRDEEDATSVVLAGTTGGRTGVTGTLAVHPHRPFPVAAPIALIDAPPWGPSGRIEGRELRDAQLAADALALDAAVVHEVAAAELVGDHLDMAVRLFQLDADDGSAYLALIARTTDGDLACLSTSERFDPSGTAGGVPGAGRLVAQQCVDQERNLVVTAVAAPPGAGPVELSGHVSSGEATERLLTVEPYSPLRTEPRVASLVDDPTVRVTLPPTGE